MKTSIIKLLTIIGLAGTATACNTGSSESNGKDTAQLKYNQTPNVDTSGVTKTTGDATNLDHSSSGGTTVAKDSVLKTGKDTAR